MAGARRVLDLYGVREFLADVDRDRQFWAEGGVVGSLLNELAENGFRDLMEAVDLPYSTAFEWRNRLRRF
jgi:hypothetical protein